MRDFVYCVPTQIVFGERSLEKLPELLKQRNVERVLVVCGGHSAKKSGLLDRVDALLKQAGVTFDTLAGVQPNPRLSLAREGVRRALALDAQLILGIGGGSVIDTAKAVAHGAADPDVDIWAYWSKQAEVKKTLPVGAILTIPAAGSETSDSAVLTNDELGLKRGLNTQLNRPAFAILDPALAATLPQHQVACGVTDIMMHTLDRYFNPVCDNETTDAIAEALLRVVIKNGVLVWRDAQDVHAMSEIMWCGSLSHNGLTGLGGQKDFAVHQLGHAVSEKFDVYHGDSLSCVWGSWARYVLSANPARFAQYARNVWGVQEAADEAAARLGIEKTEAFFASLGMPTGLKAACGVQDEAGLADLAARCSYQNTRQIGTFRKLGYDDMLKIYHMADQ